MPSVWFPQWAPINVSYFDFHPSTPHAHTTRATTAYTQHILAHTYTQHIPAHTHIPTHAYIHTTHTCTHTHTHIHTTHTCTYHTHHTHHTHHTTHHIPSSITFSPRHLYLGPVSPLPRSGGTRGGTLSQSGPHSSRGWHKDVHLERAGGVQESVEQPGGCGGAGEWVVLCLTVNLSEKVLFFSLLNGISHITGVLQ